jgi:glycosyltransferase involved in cell wall biosynthesis
MEDFSNKNTASQTRQSAALHDFVSEPHFDSASGRTDGPSHTRISIVMPSYNQALFIERSILSVLNQNYPNLQFIIMDGGSEDGTLDILRKYEARLTWRSEPDLGQSDAINKALSLADGEIVGWLNSDDVYFPGAFYRMHQAARKRPQAVLYSGTVAIIDREDCIGRIGKFIRPSARRLLYEGFVMSSQGVFWRRAMQPVARQYNPNLHHAMDVDFWLKMLAKGDAEFVPELVGGFRVYEGTKTSATGKRGLTEMSAIRKQYGVDDQTTIWRLMRTGLRISRLLQWMLFIRHHCTPMTVPRANVALSRTEMAQCGGQK